uniref:Uncharacterized protein n=1 Tax=Ananas comosus var. bracteatus TaxID=296719 RepID=A0A6V7PLZ4_ANACO|nr:unnamed protein product [Ananas comosus var. bracteatus]
MGGGRRRLAKTLAAAAAVLAAAAAGGAAYPAAAPVRWRAISSKRGKARFLGGKKPGAAAGVAVLGPSSWSRDPAVAGGVGLEAEEDEVVEEDPWEWICIRLRRSRERGKMRAFCRSEASECTLRTHPRQRRKLTGPKMTIV